MGRGVADMPVGLLRTFGLSPPVLLSEAILANDKDWRSQRNCGVVSVNSFNLLKGCSVSASFVHYISHHVSNFYK